MTREHVPYQTGRSLDDKASTSCPHASRSDMDGSTNLADRVAKILNSPRVSRTSSGVSDADKERRAPGIKVGAVTAPISRLSRFVESHYCTQPP